MPYKLRKAPKKELYWVITIETGKKHSKLPIPLDKAKAQMRILETTLQGGMPMLSAYEMKKRKEEEEKKRAEKQRAATAKVMKLIANRNKKPETSLQGIRSVADVERLMKQSGRGKINGGMIRNPLLVLSAPNKARSKIQYEIEQSDGAIGFANGKYSMEEILNRAIATLNIWKEDEAIKYVKSLIDEYKSHPDFSVKTPQARQSLTKVMGFKIGSGRKCPKCGKNKFFNLN